MLITSVQTSNQFTDCVASQSRIWHCASTIFFIACFHFYLFWISYFNVIFCWYIFYILMKFQNHYFVLFLLQTRTFLFRFMCQFSPWRCPFYIGHIYQWEANNLNFPGMKLIFAQYGRFEMALISTLWINCNRNQIR